MFHTFLFYYTTPHPVSFNPSQSAAEEIYESATTHPCPTGIVHLVSKHWRISSRTTFYGDSYLAPTPNEWTLQQIGILITKAFTLHLRRSGSSVAINTRRTSQRIPRQYGPPQDDRPPPGFATANSVPALLQYPRGSPLPLMDRPYSSTTVTLK